MSKTTKAIIFKRFAATAGENLERKQAAFVLAHAEFSKRRGRNPSQPFYGVTNPRDALKFARNIDCPLDLDFLERGREAGATRSARRHRKLTRTQALQS